MNQDRKTRFIDEIYDTGWKVAPSTKEIRLADRFFQYIVTYENVWGADVAEQSKSVVDSVIEATGDAFSGEFGGNSNLARMSVARTLYLYNRWCRSNKIYANPEITKCHYARIAKASTWVLRSPADLQTVLDRVAMPESAIPADLFRRGVAWLSYIGMSRDEIVMTDAGDYDEQLMIIRGHRNGVETVFHVPIESKACFSTLASTDVFTDYSNKDGQMQAMRVDGSALIRPAVRGKRRLKKSDAEIGQTTAQRGGMPKDPAVFVNNALYGLQKHLKGFDLSYTTLYKNGFYYRAWLEEERLPVRERFAPKADILKGPVRISEREHVAELDKMVSEYLANTKIMSNHPNVDREQREWRRKLYNDYLLWRWVAYDCR